MDVADENDDDDDDDDGSGWLTTSEIGKKLSTGINMSERRCCRRVISWHQTLEMKYIKQNK